MLSFALPIVSAKHRSLAMITSRAGRAAVIAVAWLGLGASADGAEIVAPFVQHIDKNPSPDDPLLTAIYGQGWYEKAERSIREHHFNRRPIASPLTAVIPATPIVVSADHSVIVCDHGFGEVRDLIPRIYSCPARVLIRNGGGWTSQDIGKICEIYNEDGAGQGDKAFAAYDPEKMQLRFWAVLKGKRQPECDRTVALAQ